jgi:hypothetical protein
VPGVAGSCRAVCVGHDAGRTSDANGIQVTVKKVVSITRLGASVGQTDFTKPSHFGAEVEKTEASLPFFELKSVDAIAPRKAWGRGMRCRLQL